ncbi:MAG: transposase family protein [Spirochaetaceae bacterium]|nr:transposase family protein [Spirochaetaceae bacterium]
MTCFSVIHAPRIERNNPYPLYELIVITILAVIATAQGRENIERYGKAAGRLRKPTPFSC